MIGNWQMSSDGEVPQNTKFAARYDGSSPDAIENGIKIWEQEGADSPGSLASQPFIYDDKNKHLFMGTINGYHEDIADHFGLYDGYNLPKHRGWIGFGENLPNHVGWYGNPPNKNEVETALQRAYGFDNRPQEEWNNWNTDAMTEPIEQSGIDDMHPGIEASYTASQGLHNDLQWEPGNLGKGWLTSDGSLWTWNVDPERRKPWHMDKHALMQAQGLEPFKSYNTPDDAPEGFTPGVAENGAFEITPEGIAHRVGMPLSPLVAGMVASQDPRLQSQDQNKWEFESRIIPESRWQIPH